MTTYATTRTLIVRELGFGSATVKDLMSVTGMSKRGLHHSLARMRNEGLVHVTSHELWGARVWALGPGLSRKYRPLTGAQRQRRYKQKRGAESPFCNDARDLAQILKR